MKKLLQADTRTSNNKKTNGKHCYIPTKKTKKKEKNLLILKSKKKVLMQELILNWAGENASETKEMKSFLLVLTKKTRKPKEIMQASPDFTDLKKVLFCPRARHFDS
jgi:hypothetical protein